MATPSKSAPTTELGRPGLIQSIGGGVIPWSMFLDDREYADDVRWPRSVESYRRMETDAQTKGLLMATTLPIRRFRWELDENGARPEVVNHIADSLNLPIRGQDPPPQRRRNRFSHDRHMAHALRSLVYGHYYFEQVYEYRSPRDGGDGLLHLKKLGTRPPRTIFNILQDTDGGLKGIEQWAGIGIGGGLGGAGLPATLLDVNRLVAYIWDSEDDGDWVGRSILRACFKNWLIKDRLLRVDATKHERNAMGIPWFEVDSSASQPQINELAQVAERMRAGEQSGGAGPGKLSIKGVEGSLPDTIGSVRYHDEQMSKAFLLLFFDLGKTETGSRALGSEFIDWYTEGQGAIADWYRDTTQEHQIEDEVELNWGSEEQPPLLAYTREESAELSIADLAAAVREGLIAVDEELRTYINRRWQLPAPAPIDEAPPITPGPERVTETGPAPPAPDLAPAAASARSAMAGQLQGALRKPMPWPELARAAGSDPKNGTARRARDQLLEQGAIVKMADGNLATPEQAGISLPERTLRRQPYEQEIAARVDFAAMDAAFIKQRTSLVDAVKSAEGAQIDELVSAVEAANGDPAKLAELKATPLDPDLILTHLKSAAAAGEAAARQERDAQLGPQAQAPVAAAEPNKDKVDSTLEAIAAAAAVTLAAGLAGVASRRAVAVAALPPADAAAKVRDSLDGLSDATLNTQLGGATMHAYGTGRQEFMRANKPSNVYASELLDENTCPSCTAEDGTEWSNVSESEGDYPYGGGYVDCDGGERCRGTVVAVY